MTDSDKMERPLQLYFDKLLSGDVRIMQAIGLYSMGSILKHNEPKWHFWEVIPFIIVIPALCFGVVCNISNILHIVKIDYLAAVDCAGATFTAILCTFKGFRLCAYRREFYDLISTFQTYWNIGVSGNQLTKNMVKIAELSRLFRVGYSTMVIVAFSGFATQPIGEYFLKLRSKSNETIEFTKTIYPARYPFTLNSSGRFFSCIFLESIGMYFMSLHLIAVDGIFAQITTHLSLHFQIISNRLREICPDPAVSHLKSAIIAKRLKAIVEDYLQLFKYVRILEKLYNPIIFATVLVNGLNFCSCLYNSSAHSNWKNFEKNIMHAFGLVVQTLMFCICAEQLNHEIAGIHRALYDCPWTSFNSSIKHAILLIMTLSSREYVYSTYGFIQLNMPQVTLIGTAAMRYFTMLRNFA
ncbi:odorant receptor 47a-like isoform X2 [Diachasmimorpha longicaudata]|uniref:odorant receptor 47a-like isoform X2 n=1 Tax=Diachasmimorpha longicaudata TaxID=58733 RepID=UPI0030B8CB8E